MKKALLRGAIMTLAVSGLFFVVHTAYAIPPANFQSTQIIGAGLDGPSGFEFAPDGRIFILERTGVNSP